MAKPVALEPCCLSKQMGELIKSGGVSVAYFRSDWGLVDLLYKIMAKGAKVNLTIAVSELPEKLHTVIDDLLNCDYVSHLTLLVPANKTGLAVKLLRQQHKERVTAGFAPVVSTVVAIEGGVCITGQIPVEKQPLCASLRILTVSCDKEYNEALAKVVGSAVSVSRVAARSAGDG